MRSPEFTDRITPVTGLRGVSAVILIFGVVTPSVSGVAVAAHVLVEHGSSGIDAVSLAALFHGHRHSSDTPDHDHVLVKPSSMATVVDRAVALERGCEYRVVVPAQELVVSNAFGRLPLATGCGPPPGISPLRV